MDDQHRLRLLRVGEHHRVLTHCRGISRTRGYPERAALPPWLEHGIDIDQETETKKTDKVMLGLTRFVKDVVADGWPNGRFTTNDVVADERIAGFLRESR